MKSLAISHAEAMVARFKRLGHGAPTNSEWKILISELLGSAFAEGEIKGRKDERSEQQALRDFRS